MPKLEFPTEDSNTYFISRQTDGIQQKRTYGKLIETQEYQRIVSKTWIIFKTNFKSGTKKSVESITLNKDKHRFYDSSALLLNFISSGI
ncbi:hypothetical protein Avbf_15178 [Armadillidium vulgare]|nr:hypothetical protein Avbf_15178 [Armadillidium vulgare]